MYKIKLLLLTALTALSLGTAALATVPAYAASSKQSACAALDELDSSQSCGTDASKSVVSNIVSTIVNILSLVIGAVAVIMIIVAGFKFVSSNGDSNSVASAKTTLVYALVGLVIAALAQFIVRFVLSSL